MSHLDLPKADVDEVGAQGSRFGAQAVAHLRAAFEGSRHPMLIVDDERRLVAGNRAVCSVLGLAREDVCWLTMERFTPPDEHRRLQEQWAAFLARGAAEGCYQLKVTDQEVVRLEFGATANVLASRHLLVFLPPADASVNPADSGETWTPVAESTNGQIELTAREREIMTLVAAGVRSSEIAERLFLSPETVKSHVQNAMGKLGSHTRAHAVAKALTMGQITLQA